MEQLILGLQAFCARGKGWRVAEFLKSILDVMDADKSSKACRMIRALRWPSDEKDFRICFRD
jgi:hypothetical protein